jgi:hypothetical protein
MWPDIPDWGLISRAAYVLCLTANERPPSLT